MKVCTAGDFEIPNKLIITTNEHPRAKRERANASCCSGSMGLGTNFVGTLMMNGWMLFKRN